MNPRRSLTFRLTLLFAVASAGVLLAVGYVIGAATEAHFVGQDRSDLSARLAFVQHLLARVRTRADLDALPQLLDDSLVGQAGVAIAVVRDHGEVLFATSGAPYPQALVASLGAAPASGAPRLVDFAAAGHGYRGLVAAMELPGSVPERVTVAIALNIDHHRAFMAEFRRTMWIAIAGGVLLMAALSFMAARRALVPVRAMAAASHGISASRLADRLDLHTLPAELVDLGRAYNAMLDRLQDSFRRLSEFSADIAHELRTPISTLMTQAQVALTRERTADAYREVLYANLEEFDRLARMITDMLFLAQADHGLLVPTREAVDLAAEARKLFDFYEALAEEQGVGLDLHGGGTIRGDRLMIRRALSNLLSNALRHTARGGTVRVTIAPETPDEIVIAVCNPGPEIGPSHLERVFDRFYRVDPTRSRGEGAGLGLAITRSIVEAHGGDIRASSVAGVTCFCVTLPAVGPKC